MEIFSLLAAPFIEWIAQEDNFSGIDSESYRERAFVWFSFTLNNVLLCSYSILPIRKERKLLAHKASSEGTASFLSILATSEHSSCSPFRHSLNHVS